MNDTTHDAPDESNAKQEQKFNFSFNGEAGDALGQGMDALKPLLPPSHRSPPSMMSPRTNRREGLRC